MRHLAILALLTIVPLVLPATANAEPLDQRHGGQVTVNVTPAHGQPFGFRVPHAHFPGFGFHGFGPGFGLVPFLPIPPPVVAVPVPVLQPVSVPVAAPAAVPQYPVPSGCGCQGP